MKNLKPDPEGIFQLVKNNRWNSEVIMIGDSLMDIECGRNYGAYTVAYLDDPRRSGELSKAANAAISDMEELKEIVKRNISFTYDEK